MYKMIPLMIALCILLSTCLAQNPRLIDAKLVASDSDLSRLRPDSSESLSYDLDGPSIRQRVDWRHKYVRGGSSEYEPIPHELYETDFISERMQQQRVLGFNRQQEKARRLRTLPLYAL